MATSSAVAAGVERRQYYFDYYNSAIPPDVLNGLVEQNPGQDLGLIDALRFLQISLTKSNDGFTRITQTTRTHYERGRRALNLRPNANVASPGAGNVGTFTILAAQAGPGGQFRPRVNDRLELARGGIQCIVEAVNEGVSPWTVTVRPLRLLEDVFNGGLLTTDIFMYQGNQFGEGTDGTKGMQDAWEYEAHMIRRFKEASEWTGDMRAITNFYMDTDRNMSVYTDRNLDQAYKRHWLGIGFAMWTSNPNITSTGGIYADPTARHDVTGIRYYATTNGLNVPYATGSLTVNAFQQIALYYRTEQIPVDRMICFCDSQFQVTEVGNMIAPYDTTGREKFSPIKERDKNEVFNPYKKDASAHETVALNLNFYSFNISGITFNLLPMAAVDNPEQMGATGSQYVGECIIMPYMVQTTVSDTVGTSEKQRMIINPLYAGGVNADGEYGRFLNVWKINDLRARQMGFTSSQANSNDGEKYHMLSHVGLDLCAGNSFVRLYPI